jgi:hypothetical protein
MLRIPIFLGLIAVRYDKPFAWCEQSLDTSVFNTTNVVVGALVLSLTGIMCWKIFNSLAEKPELKPLKWAVGNSECKRTENPVVKPKVDMQRVEIETPIICLKKTLIQPIDFKKREISTQIDGKIFKKEMNIEKLRQMNEGELSQNLASMKENSLEDYKEIVDSLAYRKEALQAYISGSPSRNSMILKSVIQDMEESLKIYDKQLLSLDL